MTKDEIKSCIELKQSEMPFEVFARTEALPLDEIGRASCRERV